MIITSPGWGSSSVNSGRARIRLVEPGEREKTQSEIVQELTGWTKQFSEAKVSVSETPTISVGRGGGFPIQYIIQAQNFEKLQEKSRNLWMLLQMIPHFL